MSTDEKLGALELLEEPPEEPVAPLDAPPELEPLELDPVALGDDEDEPEELGEDEDEPEELGEDEDAPEELGEDDEPELPLLPPLAELSLEPPDELLPEALGLELLPLAPLDEEPELCASETLASAKSAAAVAVVTTFRTI